MELSGNLSKKFLLDTPPNRPDSRSHTALDKIRVHPFCEQHGAMEFSKSVGVFECPKCFNQVVFREMTTE